MHGYRSFLFDFFNCFFSLIRFSLLSHLILSLPLFSFSSIFLNPTKNLYKLIKFFKFILNLDPKFIKLSPQKKKKKSHQTQNAEVKKKKRPKRKKKKKQEEQRNLPEIRTKSPLKVAVKSAHNSDEIHPKSNPNCKPKMTIHSEEDKNEPNGPCEMGLTDPYPWADKVQAQLM